MRRVILLSILSVFIFHLSSANAQAVSEIPVLSGEKWWGIYAGDSPQQPLGSFSATIPGQSFSGFRTGRLVSSAGRFIHIDEPAAIRFDDQKFTITADRKVTAEKGGRTLRQAYLVMHHRDFKDTGKSPSSDLFANLVYETRSDFGFLQTADEILAYARGLLEEGYPAGIMVLSEGWRAAPGYGFDERYYPDPAGFIGEMHRLGFRVMLTVTPYIPAWGRDFAMLHRENALVVAADGSPLTLQGDSGFFAALDLTVPMQLFGLKESLAGLRNRYGVDGFRFDCLDMLENVSDRPEFARDYLAAMQQAGAEFALVEFMPGCPEYQTDYVSSIRSVRLGQSDYLGEVITAGFAAGPFTFIEPATCGAARHTAQSEISDITLVRYALMQAMMPVAKVPFAPWKYGFAADEMKRVLTFRASLSRNMEKAYGEACKTVEPIVRPMEYIFPNSGFADCADQYMLGDKYLVAPALDDTSKRLVRLPKGSWRDTAGNKHKGPLVIEAETDGYRMSWFELQ